MEISGKNLHPWDVTPGRACEIQQQLRKKVIKEDRLGRAEFAAGIDVGFQDKRKLTRAAIAVLRLSDLNLQEFAVAERPTVFPYVPGLLTFREAPAILDALEKLQQTPDLLLCDGQGIAHPRRLGIASHLGVLTGLASIGVAKTRLTGRHGPVPEKKGRWTPLIDGESVLGAVLRTRTGVKPLYISIGHRVSLPTAIDYVMCCVTRYRLPETTRRAHKLAGNRGLAE